MNNLKNLTKALSRLNKAQLEAVKTINGPVMVIAGPGTGKTEVLTLRIANILATEDIDPSSILALTFTDMAAKNMYKRLSSILGIKVASRVRISTFHSFASSVIDEHPDFFEHIGTEPINDILKVDILNEILEQGDFKNIKKYLKSPFKKVSDIASVISSIKKEGILPDDFKKIIEMEAELVDPDKISSKQKKIVFLKSMERWKELVQIYDLYNKALFKKGYYDFEDMIIEVKKAFETNKDLLLDYKENIFYYLVDEYQDTNNLQNEIIFLLSKDEIDDISNVFVVGDPNQSIFRFQGASIENTFNFLKKFKNAKVINLKTGYRCHQHVYDNASNIISSIDLSLSELEVKDKIQDLVNGLKKPLISFKTLKNDNEPKIIYAKTKEVSLIPFFVARQIKKLIKNKDCSYKDIAVLFTKNSYVNDYIEVFEKYNIPYQSIGNYNLLSKRYINQIVTFFKFLYAYKYGSEDLSELLFKVLNFEWVDINLDITLKLIRLLSITSVDFFSLDIDSINEIEFSQYYSNFKNSLVFTETEKNQLKQFKNDINDILVYADNNDFISTFVYFLQKFDLLKFLRTKSDSIRNIYDLNNLFSILKSWVSLNHDFTIKDFVKNFNTVKNENIKLVNFNELLDLDSVVLSTVHKAKGKEWKYVFIVNFFDKVWGRSRGSSNFKMPKSMFITNKVIDEKEKKEYDERRNFYVALTRAKEKVFLVSADKKMDQTRIQDLKDSIFLSDLQNFDILRDKELDENPSTEIEKLFQFGSFYARDLNIEAFFKDLVSDFYLYSTALDKYLRNDIEFVEDVLLKVPKAKQVHQCFGTAIHAAFEFSNRFFMANGSWPDINKILEKYESALKKEILSDEDFKDRLSFGKKVLKNYFAFYKNEKKPKIFGAELRFGKSGHKVVIEDVPISGRIDRIDYSDKLASLVVVDYKTGKPKSLKDIKGINKSSVQGREVELDSSIRGSMKRQLLFYKLLIENDPLLPYIVETGIFDFVQDKEDSYKLNETVALKKVTLTLTKEDSLKLKELILQVSKEIKELKFLDNYINYINSGQSIEEFVQKQKYKNIMNL